MEEKDKKGKIRLIENNAKCRYLKKLTSKGTLRQVFYLSEAPSPPFLFRVVSNFIGSESGQKQSVKLLQNMVSNTAQHLHPLPATHSLYVLYFEFGKGGGVGEVNQREG